MRLTTKIILVLAAILAVWNTESSAKKKNKPKSNIQGAVYMFGFASSFNDSTVYFTDIQQLDSVYFERKTKFLLDRDNYSYQLRDYLASVGEEHRTCVVSYATDRKKIEKKFLKMRKKYLSKKGYLLKYLKTEEFAFEAIPQ